MRSRQTSDCLLGVESCWRYPWQHLAWWQRNDIGAAIDNRSSGNPERVSAARPLQEDVATDDNRRPAPQRKHLDGRRCVALKRSPCFDPLAVGRDTIQMEHRLLQRFAQSRPIRVNTVHESGGPLRPPEKDFAGGAKVRTPALHIRNLPGLRSPIKWRHPEAWLPFAVHGFQHDLLAVSGNVIVKGLKARRQGLRMPGLQVRHPHFSWISVRSDQPRNCFYNPVAKRFAIRCEFRVGGVAFEERNLTLAPRVMKPYGSALQSNGRDK